MSGRTGPFTTGHSPTLDIFSPFPIETGNTLLPTSSSLRTPTIKDPTSLKPEVETTIILHLPKQEEKDLVIWSVRKILLS